MDIYDWESEGGYVRDAPCQECLAQWGQEPSPWGDSVLELEAYDIHVREHGK